MVKWHIRSNYVYWSYRVNNLHFFGFPNLKKVICLSSQPTEMRRRISSELAVLAAGVQALSSGSITPCSTDTSYSDQRLDTPPSSLTGPYTPSSSASSQGGGGTPYTSRSGAPFSQDSGYTSSRLAKLSQFIFFCFQLNFSLQKREFITDSLLQVCGIGWLVRF